MKNSFLNPFYIFSFSFLVVIFLFSLHLSGLYTENNAVTLVIIVACIVYLFIGFLFNKAYVDKLVYTKKNHYRPNITIPMVFVIFGFFIDCLPDFSIPLLNIMWGNDYSYNEFGLKTFHVFYLGYVSAFSVVSFERYLNYKDKQFLVGAFLGILVTILIVNRGAMLLLITPMALLYLNQKKKSSIKRKISFLIFVLVAIIFFGYLGDKRMLSSGYQSSDIIFDIGQASDFFRLLPSGFFWVYLYGTSPFGTLIKQDYVGNVDKGNIFDFISANVIPDFISKYTYPDVFHKFGYLQLTPELTVGTGLGHSLVVFGYLGVVISFLWMFFIIIIFSWLNRNYYLKSTLAVLSAVCLFMIFDNMFIFSSCVMQLFLLSIFIRLKVGRCNLL
jgi:oligosaccharide repeat unit polymerase